MEDIQHEEPIFELAVECETLYARQITSLNDSGDESTSKVLSDMYQRFSSWASFLGVFAESNLCLDRRLRRHPEIQDQVLRLLDIMQRNLLHLSEDGDPPEAPQTEALELGDIESQSVSVRIQSLKAMSAALDRLNHVGTAIRRSIVASHTFKARQLAEKFDLTSFEQVAYILLKSLYPDSSETLIEQLTRSMIESYALFLHRQSRRDQFETERRQRARPSLHQIPEEPVVSQNIADTTNIRQLPARRGKAQMPDIRQAPLIRPQYAVPQSEPTSIDSQEVKARLKRLLSPSTKSKPVSILVNQTGYSRLRKDSSMCEWCFSPLMPDCLEGPRWQQHVNEDFKPFVCISEKCSQPLQRFSSSTEWFQHMTGEHGDAWHQEVHAPSSWICPLCTDEDEEFPSPDMLSEHLHGCHDDILQKHQFKAIVRQSRFPSLRPQATCPLCCFPISEGGDTSATQGPSDDLSQGGKQYLAKPADNGPKRIRIDTEPEQVREGFLKIETRTTMDPVSAQTVATHMSAHLQSIMVFALRLISIEGPGDAVNETRSSATDTDYQVSWSSSGSRGLDENMSEDGATVHNEGLHDAPDTENTAPWGDTVPDSEYTDWHEIPRGHEQNTINAPMLTNEKENETLSQLQARSSLIQELLNSEYDFARDMEAVVYICDCLPDAPLRLTKDIYRDIREITLSSNNLLKFSIDFQYHLREAARNVCPYPPLEGWLQAQTIENTSQPTEALFDTSSISLEEKHRASFIGKTFLDNAPQMAELFIRYRKDKEVINASLAALEMSTLDDWLKGLDEFVSYRVTARNFHTLLAKPEQRMLSYPSLLESLPRLTPDDYPDRESLLVALEEIRNIIDKENRDMKGQDVLKRALARAQTSGLDSQAAQVEAGQRIASPNQDPEFERLVGSFSAMKLQVEKLSEDVMNQAPIVKFSVIRRLQIVATIEDFVTLDDTTPGDSSSVKWKGLKRTVEDIMSTILPTHLRLVRRHITDQLANLLGIYKNVSLAIAYRDKCLVDYTQSTMVQYDIESPGRHTERAEEFLPLNEALKHELPKLHSLTTEAVQGCLHNLLELEMSLFKEMHDRLKLALDPFPLSLERLFDISRERQHLMHEDVLRLSICNGSLSDSTDGTENIDSSQAGNLLLEHRSSMAFLADEFADPLPPESPSSLTSASFTSLEVEDYPL